MNKAHIWSEWAWSAADVMGRTLAAAEPPTGVRWAFAMFLVLAILLSVFLLVIAVITVHRRKPRRDQSQATPGNEKSPDPWTESARRFDEKNA